MDDRRDCRFFRLDQKGCWHQDGCDDYDKENTIRKKLCYECKRMSVDRAEPGYSEFTPGTSMGMYCGANHWDVDVRDITREKFRQFLTMAETCPDYAPDPEMIAIG